MSVYLHDIPLAEAKAQFQSALEKVGLWQVLGRETIPLDEDALDRVLGESVWANISSPHYHAAAMDGFAIRSMETDQATLTNPVILQYGQQTEYVDTGDPLPTWANAVIPIEKVEPLGLSQAPPENPRHPQSIRIREAVTPWKHVRPLGEDIVATQLLLSAGHTLRPVDLGAIAAAGHFEVSVAKKPSVAILPTGSELVPIGEAVAAGEIIEFNSLILSSQVRRWGGQAKRFPIIQDDFDLICSQIRKAAQEADLILLVAGSSAGSEDYSARVVEALGELLVHGVAVRPGHPVILGLVHPSDRSPIPVIGVPGYPVSATMTGEIFVEPLLGRWLGRSASESNSVLAELTRKVVSPAGDDDYLRVAVGRVGNRVLAAPLSRGAGVITSLMQADGIVVIPRGSQGLPAGAKVDVRLYCPPGEIERTIFAIGSHDLTLDLLAKSLAPYHRKLTSANVGSLGGLVALRRGEAHLVGAHLLDPETGEYNLSYIPQYLPGVSVKVMGLVRRQQGLLVKKGNPKGIRSIADLVQAGIIFVNRQRGAGTRVLLDYHLSKLGIVPEEIKGYNQEEYTHLAVAAAVASDRADCGLGIAAAAHALELDFIPLFQERYDLVIPAEYFQSALLAPLFEVMKDPSFARSIAALPGYDTSVMGELVAELE